MIDRINLLPEELKVAEKKRQIRKGLILFFSLYIAVLGVLYLHQKSIVTKKESVVSILTREKEALLFKRATYQKIGEGLRLTEKRKEDLEERMEVVNSIITSRIYWSEILRRITLLLPENMWLTSLSSYDLNDSSNKLMKGIKFNGTAFSNKNIAQFIFSLENSSIFENIFLTYSEKRTQFERDLFDFELKADIRNNGYGL